MALEGVLESDVERARQRDGEREQDDDGDHMARPQIGRQRAEERRFRVGRGREHGAGRLIRRTDQSR